MIKPDEYIIKEIEEMRPKTPPGLLSRNEKNRLVERGIVGLYRWYVERSQKSRNWNADKSFNWRCFGTNHSHEVNIALEGFYAVEQYIPDYVTKALNMIRRSHGRTQFQLRWGSEEERHTDTWFNTIMFSRYRTPKWIDVYKEKLVNTDWIAPWDDPLHMVMYTLIQERATQMNYLHMAEIAAGKSNKLPNENVDPILEQVCLTIAKDEAAHYNFFLESARLWFYYFPAESLDALVDVIKNFLMPGHDSIPDFTEFEEVCARTGIYGPREHAGDVLQVVLKTLGVRLNKALVAGIKRSREVPDPEGNMRDTSLFEAIDYGAITESVKRLHSRIEDYEEEVGLNEVDPTVFVPSGLES